MKKAVVMIGAVVMAFGLFADGYSGLSYDPDELGLAEGTKTIIGYDDAASRKFDETVVVNWWSDNCWKSDFEQPAVVTNDVGGVGKYLAFDAYKEPMLRMFNKIKDLDGSHDTQPIEDHGLFVDMQVCMTGYVDPPQLKSEDDDKLLVWLLTVEDDPDTIDVNEGVTNLMVTCGYWNRGVVTPTNYVLTAEGYTAKPDQWIRLTIRADKGKNNVPAFKIYVDGKLARAVVDGGDKTSFESLFGDVRESILSAVGFDGNGGLKKVDLLGQNDAPDFAADPTTVAITWDEHVESVKIDESEIDPTVPYVVKALGKDITATITYEKGYRRKAVTPTGFAAGCFTEDIENNQFTFSVDRYANAAVKIEAESDADIAAVTVDGIPVAKRFASIGAIFDYLAGLESTPMAAMIALKGDLASQGFLTPDKLVDTEITIDLKGFTLTGVADPAASVGYDYVVQNAGTMVIVDTVGGGQIVKGTCTDGIIYNLGACVLTLDTEGIEYDGHIYNEAYEFYSYHIVGELNIWGGKFKPSKVEDEGVTIPENKKWSDGPDKDGFYTLVAKGEPTDYPDDWPKTDDATKAKFATWRADKGAGADLDDVQSQKAFLLNCTVAEVPTEEAAFKITAFTGTKASVVYPTANTKGDAFNGAVTVKAYSDAACKTEVEPASQAALFFRAILGFPTE